MNTEQYRTRFSSLTFKIPADGVLKVILDSESSVNSMNAPMHHDIAYVGRDMIWTSLFTPC